MYIPIPLPKPYPTYPPIILTTTQATTEMPIIPTQPQIIVSETQSIPKTRFSTTYKEKKSRSSTTTSTSTSHPSEKPGFFKIIYQEFVKEYKSWSYPYQILLIFFVSFTMLFIVVFCYCGICLRIFRKFKKRRQHQSDLRSNSFRSDFNVTKRMVKLSYQEETSMSPSSTNSTTCTTYASLTPKSEFEHTVETKRPISNNTSLVKSL
jgi:hypothetical protein